MSASRRFLTLLAGAATALLFTPVPAETPSDEGDIRGLRVGVAVSKLPERGFVGFTCAGASKEIDGWREYALCPAGENGLHEVSVRYDEAAQPWAAVNDAWEGTKVAGHPVLLSVLFDGGGTVEGIRVATDPSARLFYKKKAFLLGIRIMGRYGRDGWACTDDPPDAARSPVGGMLIARQCAKELPDRRLLLRTDLYRGPGQRGQEFTDATRFEIWQARG